MAPSLSWFRWLLNAPSSERTSRTKPSYVASPPVSAIPSSCFIFLYILIMIWHRTVHCFCLTLPLEFNFSQDNGFASFHSVSLVPRTVWEMFLHVAGAQKLLVEWMKHFYICYPIEISNDPVRQELLRPYLIDEETESVMCAEPGTGFEFKLGIWLSDSIPSSLLLEHTLHWKRTSRFWREPEEGGQMWKFKWSFLTEHPGVLLKTSRFSAPCTPS